MKRGVRVAILPGSSCVESIKLIPQACVLMKKFGLAILLVIVFSSCARRDGVVVSVYNPTNHRVVHELVCIDYCEIMNSLRCTDDATIVILDHSNTQVPFRVVGDSSLVFPVGAIEMHATEYYRVVPGVPISCEDCVLSNLSDSVFDKSLVVTLRL